MPRMYTVAAIIGISIAAVSALPSWDGALTDCRNQTWAPGEGVEPSLQAFGKLNVMSWHIHYNTITNDQPQFYSTFIGNFSKYFNPEQYAGFGKNQCPFGPNYGSDTFPYVCSLEGPYQEHSVGLGEEKLGGQPWTGPQRAFFIPSKHIEETWKWSQANKLGLDIVKHPNTGCMHDDHSKRAHWHSSLRDKCDTSEYAADCNYKTCAELTKIYPCDEYYGPNKTYAGWCDKTCGFPATDPTIAILEFPCNVPRTGCNDSQWPNEPPACGCSADLPLPDDSPANSCSGCTAGAPPPPSFLRW